MKNRSENFLIEEKNNGHKKKLNFVKKQGLFLLLTLFLFVGCRAAGKVRFIPVRTLVPPEDAPELIEYTIGEQDVLKISVWQWPDLETNTIVRPDGKISFPLIGDVQAAGLTLTELDEEITERLIEYIKQPEVSVVLTSFGGRKVIVLGEVADPGVYRPAGEASILEVLALTGGVGGNGVLSSVILIRGAPSNAIGTRLNLSRAIDQLDMSQNPVVQDGDIIYVPKKFIANVSYFMDKILDPLTKSETFADKVRFFEPKF